MIQSASLHQKNAHEMTGTSIAPGFVSLAIVQCLAIAKGDCQQLLHGATGGQEQCGVGEAQRLGKWDLVALLGMA